MYRSSLFLDEVPFCVYKFPGGLHLGKRKLGKLISFPLDLHYLCPM